jgi:hypothetical protein
MSMIVLRDLVTRNGKESFVFFAVEMNGSSKIGSLLRDLALS